MHVSDGYTVKRVLSTCSWCSPSDSANICAEPERCFLCSHMYTCDKCCYDYNNGHICRHIHRVHSLHRHNNLEPQCFSEDQDDCLGYSISCVESIIEPHKGKPLSKGSYIFTLCFDIDYSIQFLFSKHL